MVKVAQGRKLGALLRPVRLLSEAHPHAAVVLACQEMPPTRGDIPVPIGMSLGRNRAPGSSASLRRTHRCHTHQHRQGET